MTGTENTIQRKLVRIVLLICGAVLLLACTTILTYEFLTFRQTTIQRASTLGAIIASNSTAALAFDDPGDAAEILSALRAERPIVAAGLYTKERHLFSFYPTNLRETDFPRGQQKDGYQFVGLSLIGFQPVVQGSRRVGTLYLKWNLTEAYSRFVFYGAFIIAIMAVCLLAAAYSLYKFLKRRISEPILELAGTAKAVSQRQDYSVRARKISPEDDELGLLTGVFNHMLATIQAQNTALSHSEQRVRAVLDSAISGVIVSDSEGKIIEWNIRAEAIFGWTSAEVIGQPLTERILPERIRYGSQEEFAQLWRTGHSAVLNRVLEMTALRRDGTEFPIELSIALMEAAGVTTFCSFVTDITERKQAEVKLQTQLSRMELLERITRATAERQDLPGIFQVVIGSLERDLPLDFGCVCLYKPAEEVLTVMCIGTKSEPLAQALEMVCESDIPIDIELSVCVNGTLFYEPDAAGVPLPFPRRLANSGLNSFVAAPLPVEQDVFGVLIAARRAQNSFSGEDCEFIRQLSEHVALAAHQAKLYTALQAAYDGIRQTQQTVMQQERLRALGQMASGIAHDINNAISPIALYTESLLEKEPNLSERARGYLKITQHAIEDVAQTIARMREFYREREPQLTLSPLDLNSLVHQVRDLTRAKWSDMPQQRGIVIQMVEQLAPALPTILGVQNEIREALVNLVFNSVDAMPEGGKITMRTKATDESVYVEVSDTGTGMDEATKRRCLEPFFTTKGERGTGLGLAMVYGMAQRHNADIQIESAPAKGTTVRLEFRAAVPTVVPSPPASAAPRQPLRILAIDDDLFLIRAIREILEHDGHLVTSATGGQQGVEAFADAHRRNEPFDLVLSDLGMPYFDGRKVAACIKDLSPETPLILLTGWGQRLVAERDIPQNVDRVLNKPPRLHDLRSTIAELCSAHAGQEGHAS